MQSFNPERPKNISRVSLPRISETFDKDNAPATNHGAVTKSWAHLIAGASGGMATAVVTSPLDVLRTRLQTDFYRSQLNSERALRVGFTPPKSVPLLNASLRHIRETFQILFSIQYIEGWRGLFRGLGPSLTGVVPATAIKFYTYGNCKRLFSEATNYGKDAAIVHILAAATAGIVTGTATNPIWLVKTRLQLDKSHAEAGGVATRRYKNSLDCINKVLRQEGIRGFYRGLSASYLGAAESTLHLALYEQMKILLARREDKVSSIGRDKTSWGQAVDWMGMSGAAGASKLLAVLVAYPHEVVRTRLRQAPMENGLQKYTGLIQCFRLIWREEGILSMYGGLTPHLLRSIPSAVITLGVYEFVLKLLER